MDNYSLSRNYWDWAFENPDLVNPIMGSLYFFIVEHCNRMGWKEKFGLPTEMAMSAIGVKNYKTYYKAFSNLTKYGFIKVITKSKNQYSANVIAIVNNTKANTKALTKASLLHGSKQALSTALSSVDIDKPNNLKPDTNNMGEFEIPTLSQVIAYFKEKGYTGDSAVIAFNYYENLNWHDKDKKRVKNWKNKMVTVWFKPANKIKKPEFHS